MLTINTGTRIIKNVNHPKGILSSTYNTDIKPGANACSGSPKNSARKSGNAFINPKIMSNNLRSRQYFGPFGSFYY